MAPYITIQPIGARYAVCMDRKPLAFFNDYLSAWRFREASKVRVEVR